MREHILRWVPAAFVRPVKGRRQLLQLLKTLVLRELKVKYRGSLLGYFWSMLNPLLFMLILSLVFSVFAKNIPNYNVYILCGLLYWNFISLSLNLGTTAITRNALLLQKIRVPAWIFPMVPVLFALVNFLLSMIPFALIFAWQVRDISSHIWLAPFVVLMGLITAGGLSMALASLNVFFRDIAHVLEPILSLLFYATPIIYDRRMPEFPERISLLLGLNPFTHYIEVFRAVIIGNRPVSVTSLLVICGWSCFCAILGYSVYSHSKKRIIFYV